MGLGIGLFLIALGAILTFALNVNLGWFNLDAVGWILILTGLAGFILTYAVWKPRQRRLVSQQRIVENDRLGHEEERRVYGEEPPSI